jgi:hypothetical protein
MKNISFTPILFALFLLSVGRGFAHAAGVPERTFEGANHIRIEVKEVAPGNQPSSVQVICYLKHDPAGDTTLEAVADFDRQLGGIVASLRDSGQFEGYPLETLYFDSPKSTIEAKGVLMVGVGEASDVSIETMQNVGTVALRNAMLLNATSVSFAAALQDQNVKKLDVGDVAGAVATGVILAYDTEKRLQVRGLLPKHSINEWIIEAGPPFFSRTVAGVDAAVKKANAQVSERKDLK